MSSALDLALFPVGISIISINKIFTHADVEAMSSHFEEKPDLGMDGKGESRLQRWPQHFRGFRGVVDQKSVYLKLSSPSTP